MTAAWRRWPEPDGVDTPTLFEGVVYHHLQHALLALLVWVHGGATGALRWRPYPAWPSSPFPALVLDPGPRLAPAGVADPAPAVLAIQPVAREPGPALLAALAQALLGTDPRIDALLILVGPLCPSTAARARRQQPGGQTPPSDATPLRGVLLRRARCPQPCPAVLPLAAVEHGWSLGVRGGDLVCTYQGQWTVGETVPPATVPALGPAGYRLWRRGHHDYVLAPRALRTPSADVWDAALHGGPMDEA